MAEALKYLTDESGKRTSVVVPLTKWQRLNEDYLKLKKKVSILAGIEEGLKQATSTHKIRTLGEFLNEGNS